ncbi:MAG TPA: aromatic amino acid ammonia-lyase [Cytophagaceae bacterium]|nr:aromatic amino acid ammonia-lyase [Cytophagaceae bacterium]
MVGIGNNQLNLEEIEKILFGNEKIKLEQAGIEKVQDSYSFLQNFSKDKVIYGINTGFGPMAQYKIKDEDRITLQYNLIRSHASGCNNLFPPVYLKAIMVARLNTLMLGYSGIHQSLVETLTEYINQDIYPTIYEHGSVGASGDLVQLAHLALNLIGEGEVIYKGEVQPTEKVLKETGIKPAKVYVREGLAVMNGTSAMTGIALVNLIYAKRLLNWCLSASSMINEVVESYDDHFSYELNIVKHHKGQNDVAEILRRLTSDSNLVRKREEHLYDKKVKPGVITDKVQEYYSLRCVPQVLGPIADTIAYAESVIVNELNSVNDNPVIDSQNNNVFHGGNFHGDYVSLEMDKLKIAVTKMSMLAERQLNYLMNSKLNEKLPPFVNLGILGLNFGMQGVQFTATSTVAENQTMSFPMYVHSIPNNNDNQDIVSMGTNAATMTRKVIDNSFEVLAIEFMTLLQAVDYLGVQEKLSSHALTIYQELRTLFPKFEQDGAHYKEIKEIKNYLLQHEALTVSAHYNSVKVNK